MRVFEIVRNLLMNQQLFVSNDYLDSGYEVIGNQDRALWLMTAQTIDLPYASYGDYCENEMGKLSGSPSEVHYEVLQHAREFVDLWFPNWLFRDYPGFVDQLLCDFYAILECEAKFGALNEHWSRVLDIYMCGAMPCGVKESGSLLIHKIDISAITLSALEEKRVTYDLKKRAKRLEELEAIVYR